MLLAQGMETNDVMILRFFLLALAVLPCRAQPLQVEPSSPDNEALEEAVLRYVLPFTVDLGGTTWKTTWADLNGDDHPDALVYISGPDWCGSGGCTLLVFEAITGPDAAELGPLVPVAEISLVHGPVLVGDDSTAGWRQLAVRDLDDALRLLCFDGETYPGSPDEGLAVMEAPAGQLVFAESR